MIGSRVARRLLVLGAAACLVLAACQPTPVATRLPAIPSPSPVGSSIGSPVARPALAAALADAVDAEAILADLRHLQELADAAGGTRDAGGESEKAAQAFIAEALRTAGYVVQLQPVSVPYFRQDAPSTLEIDGDAAGFEDLRDYKAMLLSPSGDVTAQVYALGFDPAPSPGERVGLGCEPADWEDVPRGVIVLLQPGPCFRRDMIVNAQAAGAVGVVTVYADWLRDAVLRPSLLTPQDIHVPVLAATQAVGLVLAEAARRHLKVHLTTTTFVEARTSFNVLAETPGGLSDHVLMLGGHLDSAVDGPGINDNGSGTMTSLEIARRLAATPGGPRAAGSAGWKVRFGFWTGEEIGLLGSGAYVRGLDAASASAIQAYLNFDMLGSPNGVREVYDGSQTSRPAEDTVITGLFLQAFERDGLTRSIRSVGGGSDHGAFDAAGIPTGGLFSGANEPKTDDQVVLFGGTAGAPNDPCYHLPCDRVEAVNAELLGQMARAAAWAVGALASGEVPLATPG